jgi:hypothetical protein
MLGFRASWSVLVVCIDVVCGIVATGSTLHVAKQIAVAVINKLHAEWSAYSSLSPRSSLVVRLGRLALFIYVTMQAQNMVWRSPTSPLEFADCGEKLSDYLGRSMYSMVWWFCVFLHKPRVINQLVDARYNQSIDSVMSLEGFQFSLPAWRLYSLYLDFKSLWKQNLMSYVWGIYLILNGNLHKLNISITFNKLNILILCVYRWLYKDKRIKCKVIK